MAPDVPDEPHSTSAGLELDHVSIRVTAGAPEVAALERIGLTVDRHITHHAG